MKQNNHTELCGYSFHNIYTKNGPTDPLDSKSVFFLGVPSLSKGHLVREICALQECLLQKVLVRMPPLPQRTSRSVPSRCPNRDWTNI